MKRTTLILLASLAICTSTNAGLYYPIDATNDTPTAATTGYQYESPSTLASGDVLGKESLTSLTSLASLTNSTASAAQEAPSFPYVALALWGPMQFVFLMVPKTLLSATVVGYLLLSAALVGVAYFRCKSRPASSSRSVG